MATPIFAALCSSGVVAAPTYPVSARLTLAPDAAQHCVKTLDGTSDCSIIGEVRSAFSQTVIRMFSSSPTPDLELLLTVIDAYDVETIEGAVRCEIRTRTQVLAADGRVLTEIESTGSGAAMSAASAKAAASHAAEEAARLFERQYASATQVSSYLIERKIAPAAALTIPERSDRLISVVAGTSFMFAGDSDASLSPSFTVAGSLRWFMLQVTYARYSPGFRGNDVQHTFGHNFDAEMSTNDFGVESGVVIHLSTPVELRIAPGVHYIFGEATPTNSSSSESFSKVVPSVFTSLSASILPLRNGMRFVLGIGQRTYFSSTVGLPDFGRTVPAANSSFGIFIGTEYPWASRRSPR